MPKIKCFLLKPLDTQFQWLRRFTFSGCQDGHGHDASVRIEDGSYKSTEQRWEKTDPRWPIECERCHALFDDAANWQLFALQQYLREDTGELFSVGSSKAETQAPAGAMWYAPWLQDMWKGPDGKCLCVMTPGGEWLIDGMASNCTMKEDLVHKCWVRHGEAPTITVDKVGNTCAAGAGSILCGDYHGFLRDGFLVD